LRKFKSAFVVTERSNSHCKINHSGSEIISGKPGIFAGLKYEKSGDDLGMQIPNPNKKFTIEQLTGRKVGVV
jgi:hypothetical protein